MIIFRILFLLIFSFLFANSNELKPSQTENIQKIIKAFQENDIEYISNNVIKYPLKRQYPIPSIKNQEELKKRFSEVFDDKLIEEIKNSKIEDWSEMGWRGIMLNQGTLWLNFDEIIIAINYQSDFEKRLREDLIREEKEQLDSSIKEFIEPTYKIKTKNFLIRIDKIDDSKYRYSSWKIGKSESSKPDLVLLNGEIEYSGTIGYQYFTFKNRNYTYEIDIDATSLEVMKDNKTILLEKGELLNP
ncbi:hypothetical protein [Aliarcobacter butzleri]|uniref:hypothetical protein n=1 Tax=Aliarcobacter butzleri TaxID=28197 RepID=UPI00102DE774|nr:hypothetical protein [Aliarcobacter butzleri]MCT7549152.1 hypothetical protein [Aliarcobacter butzleri]MCT7558462.1 hypothetical protein [Aliarcobacter butzleri]MCT7625133.1 hypothetical protein [Aliarcobacter butzleri]MCT7643181.1 hypothetical protein [Aliarcobacter butzleri]RZV14447.1 hypothetical protein D3M61_04185 [Aliarcobacter butzleri]